MNRENLLDQLGMHPKWHLSNSKRKRTTYSINEPIIELIFGRMKIRNGLFVEFGAWDGIVLSNCRKLFDNGWGGVFIEGSNKKYKELRENYKNNEDIITINSFIDDNRNTLDKVLIENGITSVDFCSIDIDGLDLNVFKSINEILPKVICIEGGQVLFPTENQIVPTHIEKDNITQSLFNYILEFKKKGYAILCAYQDIFFIKDEYYHLFNVSKNVFELYINGIFALPRIPWLYEQIIKHKLSNKIIESIVSSTDNSNFKNRNKWVQDNHKTLQQLEIDLKNKYIF